MAIIILTVIVLCIVLVKVYIKDRISIFCAYSFIIYWGISIFISCFNPYGMKPNAWTTYIILLIGMTSFVTGFTFYKKKESAPKLNLYLLKKSILKVAQNKMLMIVYILITILCMRFAITALIMSELQGSTLSGDDRGEILFEGSSIYKFIYHFIINPLFYITLSFLSFILLARIKKRWTFIIISLAFLILSTILSGGRSKFVIAIMYFVISYVCITDNISRKLFKFKKLIISFIVLSIMLTGMAFQTGFRSTGKYSLNAENVYESMLSMGETFAIYSIIPIKLLDYSLEKNYYNQLGYPFYGRGTIAGFDGIMTGLMRRFSGIEPTPTTRIVDYLQNNEIYIIPGNHPYNYCYTALFFCYLDMGIFGVIIFPYIFGFIFRYYIFQFYKYASLPSFIIVEFGYFMMMHSLFQNYFVKNWTLLFCLILAIYQYVFYTRGIKIRIYKKSHKKLQYNQIIMN